MKVHTAQADANTRSVAEKRIYELGMQKTTSSNMPLTTLVTWSMGIMGEVVRTTLRSKGGLTLT